MNLQTDYVGITLKNPLIVSSSPLTQNEDNIKRIEAAGAAAIVMHSIFEEEIRADDDFNDYFAHIHEESFPEALTYFPIIENKQSFLAQHLYKLKSAVESVNIPIIGSLNAVTYKGWIDYAIQMQDTGIKALELNLFHLPNNSLMSGEIEKEYLDIVHELKSKLVIPLIVKLSPFFTSIPNIVAKLDSVAKVDGIVLFNRFYAPDVDIEMINLKTTIELSNAYEARLPMRWISLLHDKVNCSLAASTGVQTSNEIIKYILVGANAVTCASCILKNGIEYISELLKGLDAWMQNKNYQTIDQFRGLVGKQIAGKIAEFERAQYMKALRSFKNYNLP